MPPKTAEKPAAAVDSKVAATRDRELDAAISSITKAYGEGSIMRLGDARAHVKTRLEQEGTLSVEEKNQLYEPHEPALYCTINKLRFENQALEDIHHVQLEIGKENKIGMGYQFLKNYVSVWNYKNQTITLLKR